MKNLNNFIFEKLKISETSFMFEKLKISSNSKINQHEDDEMWQDLGELLGTVAVDHEESLNDYISGKLQIDKNFFWKYEWNLPKVFNQKVWKYNSDIDNDILNTFNSIIYGRMTDFENIKYN